MTTGHITHEHGKAADYALQAWYWLCYGRCMLTDGDTLSAAWAAMAWQRKWDAAERHSRDATALETRFGSVFPGVSV